MMKRVRKCQAGDDINWESSQDMEPPVLTEENKTADILEEVRQADDYNTLLLVEEETEPELLLWSAVEQPLALTGKEDESTTEHTQEENTVPSTILAEESSEEQGGPVVMSAVSELAAEEPQYIIDESALSEEVTEEQLSTVGMEHYKQCPSPSEDETVWKESVTASSQQVSGEAVAAPAPVLLEEHHLRQQQQHSQGGIPQQQQANISPHLTSEITFADPSLHIPEPVLEALLIDMRFERPSRIQQASLPYILAGKNVVAQAQSGSGKTLAFSIGMLSKVIHAPDRECLQALCLTPSRELANQIVSEALTPLAKHITPVVTIEGVIQGITIHRGQHSHAQVIVGTPGKTLQLIHQRYLNVSRLRMFVLDEAGAMVADSEAARSLGADTLKIHSMFPLDVQTLFFSATYTAQVVEIAHRLAPRAVSLRLLSNEDAVLEEILQIWIDTTRVLEGKLGALREIFNRIPIQQSIVFVERRVEVDRIAQMMRDAGYEVSALHSDLTGEVRDQVMETFRHQRSRVLITTNVLSRGVDVESIAVVINYDLPVLRQGRNVTVPDPVTYLHRIGRTGRFGREGIAISFVNSEADYKVLQAIERHFSPHQTMIVQQNLDDIAQRVKQLRSGGTIPR